ncbi:MAG: DUF1499 domain-containing protein [Pseudomonadota bacterium]
MKTLLIILITPLILWSLLRALIIPVLSSKTAARGVVDGELSVCQRASNCVTSVAADPNAIEPIDFADASESDWQGLLDAITSLPGFNLRERQGDYVHFESRTPLMNYRDDLELHWHRDRGYVAIRSASRLGIRDLDANANRVAMIKKLAEIQRR